MNQLKNLPPEFRYNGHTASRRWQLERGRNVTAALSAVSLWRRVDFIVVLNAAVDGELGFHEYLQLVQQHRTEETNKTTRFWVR